MILLSNGSSQKIRVSDLIKIEDIKKWKPNDNILISSPMGAGKSYFCKNILYEVAKSEQGKILMLIHRSNCVDQFRYEIETDGKADVIEVITYQSLEYSKLHNTNKYDLSQYMFIVCDEFHYFFNDSSFNNKTAVSFEMIMKNNDSVHIFMSATGEHMTKYMKQYVKEKGLDDVIEYEIPFDPSFIKNLVFFHSDETMDSFLNEGIEKGDKGIFFIQSAEKAYKLYKKYKKFCVFNCSNNNSKYYKYVDQNKIKSILINQRFQEQFLITTSCFDAGINIIDPEVKHIVVDIVDIGSLIQCIGRKRIQNESDQINVYIKVINNQQLAGLRRSIQQKVAMADYYMSTNQSMDKLIEKYPRQNDIDNILYDDFVYDGQGNIVEGAYVKKVNEPMYFKKKEDIVDYTFMLKEYESFGYCKYLATKFGFYDTKTGNCTYMLIQEDYGLRNYLKQCVDENKVFLQRKDRNELINAIKAKQDGKLLKKLTTLNHVLEERNLCYRIKEFATTRYEPDKNGVKKKKIYKHAWKVIKF